MGDYLRICNPDTLSAPHLSQLKYKSEVKKTHRQQSRSRRANPNERVIDITSPDGCDLQLAECVVHWIYCSRSCRLVAGMHSTSFVLGKGVGCLRSVFCVLVSNIDRLLMRAWCLLSAEFAVNSRHRAAAFTASHSYASPIVATRPPKLQVRLQRALWRFRRCSQNERKRILFMSDTTAVAFMWTSKRQ